MQEQIEFYEELERLYDEARCRLQSIKQELLSYEKITSFLKDHMDENLNVQKRLSSRKDDDKKQLLARDSYDKLKTKYDRFQMAKKDREEDYKRQLAEKVRIESNINSMKAQVTSIKKYQNAQDEVDGSIGIGQHQQQQQQQLLGNSQQQNKPEPVFDYDVETINFLNECNWRLGECDRSLAETLLSCFPSGTFLVRSSKTKPNSSALSVVANSKVRHCLIDKINDEYCFHPPGPNHPTYPSLCSLVMDYRHKSLLVHNPELDTNLIFPVLSQLKKTKQSTPSGVVPIQQQQLQRQHNQ